MIIVQFCFIPHQYILAALVKMSHLRVLCISLYEKASICVWILHDQKTNKQHLTQFFV